MDEEQVIPAPEAPEPGNQELSGMNKLLIPLFIILILVIGAGAYFIGTQRKVLPSPSPSISPTPVISPLPSPTPAGSPTASPKATKSPSPTPTKTPTPSPTPSPTPISFQVTSVVAVASVPGGSCPKIVNFSANITTNLAGTVTYKWERSDGAGAPTETVTFSSASTQTVTDTWTLGASYSGWERVHILTPNDLTSNNANFTVSCP